uniref:Spermatogenesis associated 25 n=1 Tax=Jaculus jaculus TaxID=51337 RepID=A0A8C5KGE1_JACJA
MSYFLSHPGLLPSGQGGAASQGSSLGLHSSTSPAESVLVASGGPGPLSQKVEQVVPAAKAWGSALAVPEARGCSGGASWETPRRKEYDRYYPQLPCVRQLESRGWAEGCSRSRAPHLGGSSRPQPLLLCGLTPGVLPAPSSEAGGKKGSSQPDICILTLAMMIAGIPTVPVPGLREEDLIRAAQAFMMAHPEPEGAVEGVQWGQAHAYAAAGQMPLVRSGMGQAPACSWMK